MLSRHYADEDVRESEPDRPAEDDGHDGPEDDVRDDFLASDQQIGEQKAENPAPNHRS